MGESGATCFWTSQVRGIALRRHSMLFVESPAPENADGGAGRHARQRTHTQARLTAMVVGEHRSLTTWWRTRAQRLLTSDLMKAAHEVTK
jgi:hypothetical protein